MSYILDALRRADSERERGAIPGIHAQPVPAHWRERGSAQRPKPWVGVAIGFSVVVLGAFAWHLAGRETPQEVTPSAASATPSPVSAAPTAPAAPAPAMIAPAPPAVAQSLPAPSPPAVAVAPTPPAAKVPERPRAPASPSAEPARRKASPPTTVAEPVRAPTKPEPGAADARIYAQSELPQEVRSQLPTLAIGGSMYSENPSSRMLIVNGQLVHEGDALAPGLSLEQIKLKSAILRFKGYRYEIMY